MDAFCALGEPKRRQVVELIARNGRMTASQISDRFDVTPQAISQHLKVLLEVNVLSVDRVAQMRYYSVNAESIEGFEKWAHRTLGLWDRRLDRLEKVLEQEKEKRKK